MANLSKNMVQVLINIRDGRKDGTFNAGTFNALERRGLIEFVPGEWEGSQRPVLTAKAIELGWGVDSLPAGRRDERTGEVRAQALALFDGLNEKQSANVLASLLVSSFAFVATKQGAKYWEDVYANLCEIAQQGI